MKDTYDLDSIVQRKIDEALMAALASLRTTPPHDPPRPALLSRAHLARELAVSLATVDRLCRRGLPFVRVGDVRRFRLKAVLRWIDAEQHQGTRTMQHEAAPGHAPAEGAS